ncbi:acetylornithine transaminase [Paenibacillus guangzhouensis]|uniref:acetylornithine transaminase n=1 Tax=Paenibacillus guangzhouensis TaxID=1473112 RepID=UPI00126710F8|nr:acetylornithine transaminase [Paenibacillus guangzhouensis]
MSGTQEKGQGQVQSALFPTYARFPISLVKGEGSYVWDEEGRKYLDFTSGIAVNGLGHAPKQVKEKLVSQLDELWHVSNIYQIPNQEKAAQLLTANSCADAVFFCNSGAEANEAAIKLARRYHQKVLGNGRYEVITFTQSFHGRTLATLTATGQDKVKDGYLPLPEGFKHVPMHDEKALEAAIGEHTCAIMLELVQAEGGIVPVEPSFVQHIVKLCKEHNLLLIIDEVQTGIGRTGKLFAYEHYGIEPDIFTLAKALGSGFPVGAMLGKAYLRDAFTAGSHASTFGGTPIAMAAVIATLETIVNERLSEHAADMGDYLMQQLQEKLEGNTYVTGIRGKGLIIGIECIEPAGPIIAEAQQKGLLTVAAGPNVVRLLPNLLVTREEIDIAVGVLNDILTAKAAVKQ